MEPTGSGLVRPFLVNFDLSIFVLAAATLPVAATALLIDRLFGYPNGLQEWVGHPVEWIGQFISAQDAALNAGENRKIKGIAAVAVTLALVAAIVTPLALWLRSFEGGWVGEALLASMLLPQKSLENHVEAVANGLQKNLAAGREAVRHIIGRDPDKLDKSGVAKGAIESLAENMSDGVVAPLFWLLVAGLPGIAIYKVINTADSMIGHRSERYRDFGWAAARLDDLVNLIPARATGWLIALAGALLPRLSGKKAVTAMARDARQHLSPNAGWPEAAMAGSLGIRLGGPRSYDGSTVDLAFMGDGRDKVGVNDIHAALRAYGCGLNLLTGLVIAACIMSWTA